jgi:hypothetical protein
VRILIVGVFPVAPGANGDKIQRARQQPIANSPERIDATIRQGIIRRAAVIEQATCRSIDAAITATNSREEKK